MERKSKIAAILNKYKDTFYDLIDNLNTESLSQLEFPNWPKLIDKGTRNMRRSGGASSNLSKEDYLDEDVLVTLWRLAPKI